MGAAKSEKFTLKDNRIAKYAKALGHPARIAIFKLLIKSRHVFVEISLMNSPFAKYGFTTFKGIKRSRVN